ncbi:biotin--protein ligase isoform X1 [Electrophorus electricus]|uniref:Holocarboxylase synthetase (biotin-(proprionyl-CoA-carboxylase (ATP-hydrolysing)) ligase) n=2 Tax=Electrophorus electricus TaxID=8005 RepID=A0A4W4FPT1_ELEEL|nr:biotin--protein ligase isoform X1 [Electrophorus electricus]
MLITLCYVYLWVRFQRCYAGVVRSALDRLRGSRSSFAFCALKAEGSRRRAGHPTRDQTLRRPRSPVSQEDTVFLRLGDKVIYVTELQTCDDLSKWTLLLGSSLIRGRRLENVAFIIEAAVGHRAGQSPQRFNKKVLTWSDYCLPLACRPGQPYRAVAEASLDNFSTLGVAFLEDRLQMENGLIPEKIVSVYLRESALKELFEKQQGKVEEKPKLLPARIPEETILSATSLYEQEAESVLRACRSSPPLADRQDSDSDPSSESRPACDQQGQPRPVAEHSHMEGHHHLHLSSCHECLELENSTIQSVKFASVENIPDLPDDDCAGGDVAAGSQASPGRANARGKPPNVLVFTGGCEERYGRIRALLAECIDVERYTIYQLRPQQALSEPWLESTALLVLADDGPLTPQLQLCFLTYLSQGGRVLGLSSALCPAGLRLRPRRGQRGRICRLSFTKADSTEVELSALTGGMTYEREPRDGDASRRVEVWGELRAPDTDRDAVIIRVSHGEEGGEAVLCQVCLETAPDSEQVQGAADFSELKMSNARRYEVLTEIFTSLGLSCELSQMPPPSPVYVLSTQSELRDSFVHWLRGNVDDGGVVRCAGGARLRVVWGPGEAAMLAEGELALHPEAPEILPKHFCMQTYSRHLQTQRLGRTLLYANVTPTTMDLLEGMMLQLPDDMGLIAVAARQTKGKGRAGNAWLGPLGSAMFTLHLRVEVSSTLGRRVPFLQHLAALAMVEAVRTLPGYEDIDLRVKWPNDIYFGNLIKLGGVLVSSTAMASTFHLLVGCGLNVSNSNPTICVNDLVAQHNREHGCSLEPLSPEQLIGRSVTLLEELIGRFQLQGPQAALPLYYQRWVHGGTQVRLWSEEGPVADVVGLDDHGFLQVSSREHGLVSVQPDGNSFDMMRNLVVTKH